MFIKRNDNKITVGVLSAFIYLTHYKIIFKVNIIIKCKIILAFDAFCAVFTMIKTQILIGFCLSTHCFYVQKIFNEYYKVLVQIMPYLIYMPMRSSLLPRSTILIEELGDNIFWKYNEMTFLQLNDFVL